MASATRLLVDACLIMSLFGAAMIYSAGQLEVPDPADGRVAACRLMWIGISLVVLFVVMRIPVRWLEWFALPAYVVGLVVLAITLVIGEGAGTAASMKGWIRFGGFPCSRRSSPTSRPSSCSGRLMGNWREPPRPSGRCGSRSPSRSCPC
jgi:cell division protein FtsW (lipid II flippase)